MNICLQFQGELGLLEPIDFIFDTQSEQAMALDLFWPDYVKGLSEMELLMMGNPPVFRKDEEALPLQAADLIAWWMRKRYEVSGSLDGENFPFPWASKVEIPRIFYEVNEEDIRFQLNKLLEINLPVLVGCQKLIFKGDGSGLISLPALTYKAWTSFR